VVVDEYGQRVPDKNEHILMLDNKKQGNKQSMDPFAISRGEDEKKLKETKKFTPVDKYKPGGSLVYDEELFKSLKDPFSWVCRCENILCNRRWSLLHNKGELDNY